MTPKTLTPTNTRLLRINLKRLGDGVEPSDDFVLEITGIITYTDTNDKLTELSHTISDKLSDIPNSESVVRALLDLCHTELRTEVGLDG